MRYGFIKVCAASPSLRVADCAYNAQKILETMAAAQRAGVRLLVLPELGLTGYTCGDLFLQDALLDAARAALLEIAAQSGDMVTVLGLPLLRGGKLYNTAAVVQGGQVLGLVPKTFLPNYGEFYELRHFTPPPEEPETLDLGPYTVFFGTKLLFCCTELPEFVLAAELCEDLWAYNPPSTAHAAAGATVIVNLSASNELAGKADYRRSLVQNQSGRLLCGYVYADAGAGESSTDMVFGAHNIIAENGEILAQRRFSGEPTVSEIDVNRCAVQRRRMNSFPPRADGGYVRVPFSLTPKDTALTRHVAPLPFVPANPAVRNERCEEILTLQSLGLQKRLPHTRAKAAVINVSGGLDSTLALLVIARTMDALGRPRSGIIALSLPGFGTTKRTHDNAATLCAELGVTYRVIPIGASVRQHFADIGHPEDRHDVVYENSQARERTQVLMDVANQAGGLAVGTGDLSELALGWATYNGDHMSMYGVNASVPKTLVRYLVAYEADRSESRALATVLRDILDTPVSPELLPAKDGEISQKTEELVGPYELHDFFLYYAIRWAFPPQKVLHLARHAFAGREEYTEEVLLHWLKNFYRRFFSQQFKRSCLPDGPKVGTVALSPRGDWRMPSDAEAEIWLRELE